MISLFAIGVSAQATPIQVSVDGAERAGTPQNFIGFSWETWSVPLMTGKPGQDPSPITRLISNLSSGGPINLRIGGNSQDVSWWLSNPKGVPSSFLIDGYVSDKTVANRLPQVARGTRYFITPSWINKLAEFLRQSGMETIFGLNLSLGNVTNARQLVDAIARSVDKQNILAFELGNEPDLYAKNQRSGWHQEKKIWVKNKDLRRYGSANLFADWSRFSKAMPLWIQDKMLSGPALANPDLSWSVLSKQFYSKFKKNLKVATHHLYAFKPPWTEKRTLPKLLSDSYSSKLGNRLGQQPALAHQAGLKYRIGEFNTACIGGESGVSDRFAAALWAPSALRSVAQAGADGVNVHFGYGTSYKPFWPEWKGKIGLARVAPLYYGLYFFSQTTGAGSKEIPLKINSPQSGVDTWLNKMWNGTKKLAMVNRSGKSAQIKLSLPAHGAGKLYRMTAPGGPSAAGGVTWAGRTFGTDGRLSGDPITEDVLPQTGVYTINLPAYSGAVLAIPS